MNMNTAKSLQKFLSKATKSVPPPAAPKGPKGPKGPAKVNPFVKKVKGY